MNDEHLLGAKFKLLLASETASCKYENTFLKTLSLHDVSLTYFSLWRKATCSYFNLYSMKVYLLF
jgi:hypothetical protein